MKKSVLIRLCCLVIAAAVLSGALIVAAVTGSPYDTLKRSVLDTMMLKNGAVKGEFSYAIDGVTISTDRYDAVYSETASVSKSFNYDGTERSFGYRSGNLYIGDGVATDDGTQWYYGYVQRPGTTIRAVNTPFGIGALDEEQRNSASMRFAELAIDALVGDLKNNVTMSEREGLRHVSATLTASQLPALAQALLDMIAEQSSGYYGSSRTVSIDLAAGKRVYERVHINNMEKTVTTYEQTFRPMTPEMLDVIYNDKGYNGVYGEFYGTFIYPEDSGNEYMINSEKQTDVYTVPATRADYAGQDQMNMPMKAIKLDYAHGEGDIDANGYLVNVSVNCTATIETAFGDSFELELRGNMSITEVGTARVDCPIPDAERVLTADFIESKLGEGYISFYFKLNPDGSVDLSSVTSQYPGELGKGNLRYEYGDGPVSVGVIGGTERIVVEVEPNEVPAEETGSAGPAA